MTDTLKLGLRYLCVAGIPDGGSPLNERSYIGIRTDPGGHVFHVEPGETLAQAADRIADTVRGMVREGIQLAIEREVAAFEGAG